MHISSLQSLLENTLLLPKKTLSFSMFQAENLESWHSLLERTVNQSLGISGTLASLRDLLGQRASAWRPLSLVSGPNAPGQQS